jgi:hypothetical protein
VCSEHCEVVKKLAGLHILHEQMSSGRLPGWKLNEVFRRNLKIALVGGCVLHICVNQRASFYVLCKPLHICVADVSYGIRLWHS